MRSPRLFKNLALLALLVAPDFAFADNLTPATSILFAAPNAGIVLKQGSNGFVGTFTAIGTSAVTVANTNVAVADAIVISLKTVGGTVGAIPAIQTITAGTGFTVAGTAADTSTYNYAIIKNVP